jgi:hypothetical protein
VKKADRFEHLLRGRKYHRVLGTHPYNVHDIFINGRVTLTKNVTVFNHNTPHSRVLSDDYGSEIVIHHNHYITSFLDNLACASFCKSADLECCLRGKRNLSEIYAYFARKFVAEQMLETADSRMGRVVFLENLIAFEEDIRSILTLRSTDERLAASSNLFTSIASDFLLHHELGHVLKDDVSFTPFFEEGRNYISKTLAALGREAEVSGQFEEEVASDIFGLTVVLKVYSEIASAVTLRDYVRHLVHTIIRLETLYHIAEETHRINVIGLGRSEDIDTAFVHLLRRLNIMDDYVSGIEFGKSTVETLSTDSFIPIMSGDEVNALSETNFSAPVSGSVRRVAEAISTGFEPGHTFSDVVESFRTTRTVMRPMTR